MFQLCGSLKCFSRCWNRAALWHRVNRSGLSKLGYTQLLKVAADYCWCDGPVPHDRISLPALCFCLPGALQRILCLKKRFWFAFSVRFWSLSVCAERSCPAAIVSWSWNCRPAHLESLESSWMCPLSDQDVSAMFNWWCGVYQMLYVISCCFPPFLFEMTWVLLLPVIIFLLGMCILIF